MYSKIVFVDRLKYHLFLSSSIENEDKKEYTFIVDHNESADKAVDNQEFFLPDTKIIDITLPLDDWLKDNIYDSSNDYMSYNRHVVILYDNDEIYFSGLLPTEELSLEKNMINFTIESFFTVLGKVGASKVYYSESYDYWRINKLESSGSMPIRIENTKELFIDTIYLCNTYFFYDAVNDKLWENIKLESAYTELEGNIVDAQFSVLDRVYDNSWLEINDDNVVHGVDKRGFRKKNGKIVMLDTIYRHIRYDFSDDKEGWRIRKVVFDPITDVTNVQYDEHGAEGEIFEHVNFDEQIVTAQLYDEYLSKFPELVGSVSDPYDIADTNYRSSYDVFEKKVTLKFKGMNFFTGFGIDDEKEHTLNNVLKLYTYADNLQLVCNNNTIKIINRPYAEGATIRLTAQEVRWGGEMKRQQIKQLDSTIFDIIKAEGREEIQNSVNLAYNTFLAKIKDVFKGEISTLVSNIGKLKLNGKFNYNNKNYKVAEFEKITSNLYRIVGWKMSIGNPLFVLTETYPPTGVTAPYLTEMPTCYFSNAIDETTLKAENIQLLFSEDGESFITYPGITFKTGYHDKGFYIKLDTPTHVLESARSYRLIIMPGLKDVFGQSVFNEQTIVITFRIL